VLPGVKQFHLFDGGDPSLRGLDGCRTSVALRVRALLECKNPCVYLDNDIYVVSKYFAAGFDIAERFGLAMPMNPRRVFQSPHGTGDLDLGDKVDDYDREVTGGRTMMRTAMNFGVIFKAAGYGYGSRIEVHEAFLKRLRGEIRQHLGRGQAALARALLYAGKNMLSWEEYHPYVLAPEFCASQPMQNAVALHVGGKYHKHMLDHYNEFHRA
jgi:hypothetical protein